MLNRTKKTFHSNILEKDYEYYILTADEVTEDAYLLYVQDGKDYLDIGELEKAYQDLLKKQPEIARKFVFILVHPGDSMDRWNAYHHEGENFSGYIAFMTEEFFPKIEAAIGRKIVHRGLLGDSLAANVSLNIAAMNPERWTHLLLQSAAVTSKDIAVIERLNQLQWRIYQTVGKYEDEYVSLVTNEKLYILSRNQELNQTFAKKGALVKYSEQEEKHEWKFWRRDLIHALEFFLPTS
ncbi:alpha/beta hydrolase [Oceanobacillus damuensis]|uniref:alpha/beta hydrolase n=1 Tax=Oceanobacillus damuensis TaxID=937928 RepID=UPI0008370F4F|nr:alpha/beta hydrolase-fold protein [Oceanobacillus damuensis]